jgi:hypothetical protein
MEQFHDEERATAFEAEVMDGHDVGVRETSRQPCLVAEALCCTGALHHLFPNQLRSDLSAKGQIDCGIDGSHPALAQTTAQ